MDHLAANRCQVTSSGPKYFLTAQAYCCEFNDGAIILDMRAAAYLGIDAGHLSDLRACVGNWPNSFGRDPDAKSTDNVAVKGLIADLLNRGILTTTPTQAHSCGLENPTSTLTTTGWAAVPRRIPIAHIVQFSASLLLVLLRCRDQRLASLLAWIRRRQVSIHRDGHSSTWDQNRELVASFLRLRIWFYTAYRHCLFDSLVLSVFLTRRMVPCTLVIGVSTKPFVAHSWVQIGECVLNDTVEYVQSFTPILAVGEFK
jgi:Transglutaminase-like superfamily